MTGASLRGGVVVQTDRTTIEACRLADEQSVGASLGDFGARADLALQVRATKLFGWSIGLFDDHL